MLPLGEAGSIRSLQLTYRSELGAVGVLCLFARRTIASHSSLVPGGSEGKWRAIDLIVVCIGRQASALSPPEGSAYLRKLNAGRTNAARMVLQTELLQRQQRTTGPADLQRQCPLGSSIGRHSVRERSCSQI